MVGGWVEFGAYTRPCIQVTKVQSKRNKGEQAAEVMDRDFPGGIPVKKGWNPVLFSV
jgi:hypothetical protein